MSRPNRSLAICLTGLVTLLHNTPGASQSWPQFRGPNHDLTAEPAAALETERFGLELVWKVPIGSGYSQLVADAGAAYVMHSDSTYDVLVSLGLETGAVLWSYRMGPTFKGRQGSMDGPLSTPVIGPESVVGLSGSGRLFAVSRTDGAEIWQRDLVAVDGAQTPEYGVATSPLLVGDLVVVNVGGADGHSVMAFHLETGDRVWATASGTAAYQSPSLVTLHGDTRLLTITGFSVKALDAATGAVQWEHTFAENAFSANVAHVVPVGPDRILLHGGDRVRMLRIAIAEADGATTIEQVWESRHLKNTYAIPVLRDGRLFGYSGNFLSAIDAVSGERIWRSRPPGKGSTMMLGDILVVWDVQGRLTLVRTDGDSYEELAQLRLMERASITNPVYADGVLLVRSHTHAAAVRITDGSTPTAAVDVPQLEWRAPRPVTTGPGIFGRFLEAVRAAADPASEIDAFVDAHTFPLIDGDRVHFVYRGEAEDLGLYLGYTWRREPDDFERVPGTDLWHLSYRLEPGGRYDYQLRVDLDDIMPDPLNPRRSPAHGEVSQLAMPGWSEAAYLADPAGGERGRIDSVTFASQLLGNERTIEVYLPPGYDGAAERAYPLVLVTDDADPLTLGQMRNTLDNLIGVTVAPCIVAFEHYPRGRRWAESFLTHREEHAQMLGEELLPYLRDRYRVRTDREATVLMGTATGAHAAVYTALRYPDLVGKVASQSLLSLGPHTESIVGGLPDDDARLELHMEWCTVEIWDPGESFDQRHENERLVKMLRAAGHEVTAREIGSGTGWGTWRNHTGQLLAALLPLTIDESKGRP